MAADKIMVRLDARLWRLRLWIRWRCWAHVYLGRPLPTREEWERRLQRVRVWVDGEIVRLYG